MFSKMATAAAATMPEPPKIKLTISGAPLSTDCGMMEISTPNSAANDEGSAAISWTAYAV